MKDNDVLRARMNYRGSGAFNPGNDDLELHSRMLVRGPRGPKGDDGFSPIVTVTEAGEPGEYLITIEDAKGKHRFELNSGKSPYINEQGNWNVWNGSEYIDSGVKAQGNTGKTPYVGENGNWYTWDDASGEYVDTGIIAGGAENCEERLSALEQRFEDMDYGNGIVINSFSHNQTGTKERGSVVTGLTLSWRFDRKPVTQTLTGPTLDSAGVSPTISGKEYSYPISGVSINADNQGSFRWKIAATDNRGKAVSQTSPGFTFYNCVYYGAADEPEVIDSLFIRSLGTKTSPTSGKPSGINVNGGGKYIWYCLPTGSGTCTFKSNGFPAGIELVDTIAFTNALGYTENYYVYRSNQKITDTVTIEVS